LSRALRIAGRLAVALLAAVALALAGTWLALRASLPRVDGSLELAGLAASVTIERDAAGVPTVTGTSRSDVAFATGFLHAQDRFFQMDLSRRVAAGELAALVGAAALPHDERVRRLRFRSLAREVLARATPAERALADAYVRGVNAGLASLGARPPEYLLLRTVPQPWTAEDSVLVVYAMWWDLQYGDVVRERVQRAVAARVEAILAGAGAGAGDADGPATVLDFLFPRVTEWDAPNYATLQDAADGARGFESPPVPAPEIIDLRKSGAAAPPPPRVASRSPATSQPWPEPLPDGATVGSNNWALAGSLSATGAALVANDMHLGLRVPATWYRMRLRVVAPGTALDLAGVTLPGTPVMVAGSNGAIAWGFTNSYGNWSGLRSVSCEVAAGTYMTDDGPRRLRRTDETIEVRGAAPVHVVVQDSPAGVLLDAGDDGHSCTLLHWLALDPGATNFRLGEFEHVTSAAAAVALAPEIGMPEQNLIVGDREGHIGWTIIGRIARGGGAQGWRGAAEQPAILDPESGRLWSANARAVDGEAERAIEGDAFGSADAGGLGYDLAARARQIRDALFAVRGGATPRDMLAVQLDDRALFLARWHRLLGAILDEDAVRNAPQRAQLRALLAQWDGRADADSVAYTLVREFRAHVRDATWQMLLGGLGVAVPAGDAATERAPSQFEGPLWRLVTEQPPHLLAPGHDDWRAFLLGAVDRTIRDLRRDCGALERCRWGARHPVVMRHPLSGGLPGLGLLLDMPALRLPGDRDMPRVQMGAFGASQRFAVSPGHEAQGYLEIAGGVSGHPLSPWYRSGLDDWATGRPTPFLPGAPQHKLELTAATPAAAPRTR
jgi:penicillin amidase